jgi:molybdopterin/thiamine biosynthesis adenylyltransferase
MSSRYDRQTLIPGWHQQSLTDAKVVIAGVGALGNEAARILAMSGVGQLILCDPDRVEESNLSRTLLFRPTDVGRLKVEAAVDGLKQLAPEIIIHPIARSLVQGIGLAELRDASLVLGCLDSRSARMQLAGRCQLVRAPYIDGGTHPWGGEVRPYVNPDGPCYGCSLSPAERGAADAPWSCLDSETPPAVGAAAASSAVVGAWLGTMAVRFLLGLVPPTGTLSIDASRGTTVIVQQERDPECPLHHPLSAVTVLDVGSRDTVKHLLDALPRGAVPLLWEPVLQKVECVHCGFNEERWGKSSEAICPLCQRPLVTRLTLEIDHAPGDMKLAELGLPAREILAVRTQDGFRWFELKD